MAESEIKGGIEMDRRWRIDKHINVGFILAVAIQTFGAVWWASRIDATIEVMANRITALEAQTAQAVVERQKLAVLETSLSAVKENIADSKIALRKIEDMLVAMYQTDAGGKRKQ
jgi:hypothetical protein